MRFDIACAARRQAARSAGWSASPAPRRSARRSRARTASAARRHRETAPPPASRHRRSQSAPGIEISTASARGGRDRLMDRAVRRRSSAEFKNRPPPTPIRVARCRRRSRSTPHHRPLRHLVAELPAVTPEQEPEGGREGDANEDVFEQPLRCYARDCAAGDRPGSRSAATRLRATSMSNCAAEVLGAERTDRGRNDDGERGADAKRHPHLQRHAGRAGSIRRTPAPVARAAAGTPNQAGQKTRQRAGCNQEQAEFDDSRCAEPCHSFSRAALARRLVAHTFLNRASGIPASRGRRPLRSRHICRAHLKL